MKGTTHLAGGILAAVATGASTPEAVLAAAGSLLPDIDHMNSKIGRHAKIVGFFLTHRGFTHSLAFAALATAISPYLGVGVATHIALDCCTPQGVQLLWPWNKFIRLPLVKIKTGSITERLFCFGLIVIIGALIYPALKGTV